MPLVTPRILLVLATLSFIAAAPLHAQIVAAPDAPLLPAIQPQPEMVPATQLSAVLERLERAERRIETMQSAEPGVVATPQNPARRSGGDPSVVTGRQQNYAFRTNTPSDTPKKWWEKLTIRGYAQFRINEVIEEDPLGAPAHYVGDRSIGDNQSFLIRRARVIISGDVSDYLYVYLQPDFASSVPGVGDQNHFTQIRDWYGDCYLDKEKVYRIRVGQSKVPYGWENMQSSSNRIPFDRNDAFNSAVRNERDLGAFFYYTPEYAQDFFKDVLEEGLKGSGNYGMFALGIYNGQGGSFQEQNDGVHIVSRLTLPMQLENGQYLEASIQGYTGRYVVLSSLIRPQGMGAATRPLGTLETGNDIGHLDQRVGTTFVWYPQPLGFQAEWTVGRGPALNEDQTLIEERALYGGYAMVMYRYETPCHGIFIPYCRYSQFQGGYKSERNAPYSRVNECELGCEWQLNPQMELTAAWLFTNRTNTTAFNVPGVVPYEQFDGQVARLQFQINY